MSDDLPTALRARLLTQKNPDAGGLNLDPEHWRRAHPMKPLTDEEIANLRKIDSAASPAPWLPYSRKSGEEARVRSAQPTRWLFEALPDGEVGIDESGKNCQADHDVLAAAWSRNALPRLLDFAAAARALLKRIEWSGAEPDFHEERADACPVCRELKSPHAAHKPDCELAALIA